MLQEWLTKGVFLYLMAGVCGIGVVLKVLLSTYYNRQLYWTQRMATAGKRWLVRMREDYEECMDEDGRVNNVDIFVDKYIEGKKFMGILLSTWNKIGGQAWILCAGLLAVSAVSSVFYQVEREAVLFTFFIGTWTMIVAVVVDNVANLAEKKKQIKRNLVDYFENRIRMQEEEFLGEESFGVQDAALSREEGSGEEEGMAQKNIAFRRPESSAKEGDYTGQQSARDAQSGTAFNTVQQSARDAQSGTAFNTVQQSARDAQSGAAFSTVQQNVRDTQSGAAFNTVQQSARDTQSGAAFSAVQQSVAQAQQSATRESVAEEDISTQLKSVEGNADEYAGAIHIRRLSKMEKTSPEGAALEEEAQGNAGRKQMGKTESPKFYVINGAEKKAAQEEEFSPADKKRRESKKDMIARQKREHIKYELKREITQDTKRNLTEQEDTVEEKAQKSKEAEKDPKKAPSREAIEQLAAALELLKKENILEETAPLLAAQIGKDQENGALIEEVLREFLV